jgi:hypothetical protein
MIVSRWILLSMRNVSQTKVAEEIKTHISWWFFFPENQAVYEIMWKKYGKVRQATDENIIRHMPVDSWIKKAKNTHSKYDSYCFSTATMVMRPRFSITFYVTLPMLFCFTICELFYIHLAEIKNFTFKNTHFLQYHALKFISLYGARL